MMRRGSRWPGPAGLFAALVLGTGACEPPAADQAPDAAIGSAARDTVRMALRPFLSNAPIFLARGAGHFEARGLEVEILPLPSGPRQIPLLLSGDLDVVASVVGPGFLNAVARGGRVRLVAGKDAWDPEGCDLGAVLAHRSLFEGGGPETVLAGPDRRRLSLSRYLYQQYLVDEAFRTRGLDRERFEVLDLAPVSELQAFADGTLALSVTSEPWLTRALDEGNARKWIPVSEVLPGFQYSYYAFGPSLLDERPDVGVRFVEAVLAGVDELRKGKTDRNVRLLAEETGLEEELLRRACWPASTPETGLNAEGMRGFQEWLLRQGALDRFVEPGEYWDGRFLAAASKARDTTPAR